MLEAPEGLPTNTIAASPLVQTVLVAPAPSTLQVSVPRAVNSSAQAAISADGAWVPEQIVAEMRDGANARRAVRRADL